MSSPSITTAGSRSISSYSAWRIASSIVVSGTVSASPAYREALAQTASPWRVLGQTEREERAVLRHPIGRDHARMISVVPWGPHSSQAPRPASQISCHCHQQRWLAFGEPQLPTARQSPRPPRPLRRSRQAASIRSLAGAYRLQSYGNRRNTPLVQRVLAVAWVTLRQISDLRRARVRCARRLQTFALRPKACFRSGTFRSA